MTFRAVDATRLPLAAALPGGLVLGLLCGLAFAPWGAWPLAILAVGGLTILVSGVRPRRAAAIGYAFGLGLMALNSAGVEMLGGWIVAVLVAFMALWVALIGWATNAGTRLPGWPIWVACVWLAAEFGYSRIPLGGFGWARLAWTTPDQPLSGFLPLIGANGVSWLVAFSGALLAWLALAPGRRRALITLIALVALFGGGAALRAVPVSDGDGDQITVGMVQGNVDGSGGPRAMGYARSVTNNHFSETATLMAKVRVGALAQPDFLLWPENSTDIDPNADAATRLRIEQSTHLADLPILVGAISYGPGDDERQTTSMWWDPELGETARYSKRNLVPFGEYTPFRSLVQQLIPMTQQVGRQSVVGTAPAVLRVSLPGHGEVAIGPIICYELAFDPTVYDTVRWGQQLLVVQSNNATYTGTAQPHQQFAITRVRAMELRREIVVSTTSSFSGLIDARGRVLDRTDEATAAARSYTVPLRTGTTPAIFVAPWLGIAAIAFALGAIVLGRRRPLSSARADAAH